MVVGQYVQAGLQLEELAVHASIRFEKQPKQPHKVETQVEVRLCLGVDWEGRLDVKKNQSLERNKKSSRWLFYIQCANGGRKKWTIKHHRSWCPRGSIFHTREERPIVQQCGDSEVAGSMASFFL